MIRARIYVQQYVFFLLLMNAFVSNVVQEPPHDDDVNGGAFVLHILDKMHVLWYITTLDVFLPCDVECSFGKYKNVSNSYISVFLVCIL